METTIPGKRVDLDTPFRQKAIKQLRITDMQFLDTYENCDLYYSPEIGLCISVAEHGIYSVPYKVATLKGTPHLQKAAQLATIKFNLRGT